MTNVNNDPELILEGVRFSSTPSLIGLNPILVAQNVCDIIIPDGVRHLYNLLYLLAAFDTCAVLEL